MRNVNYLSSVECQKLKSIEFWLNAMKKHLRKMITLSRFAPVHMSNLNFKQLYLALYMNQMSVN